MKPKLLVKVSLASAILMSTILGGASAASAAVNNVESNQNTERTVLNGKWTNETIRDSGSVLLHATDINSSKNHTNGQISNVVNNNFTSNKILHERELMTTIRVTARPYATVWKFTSGGKMVKTGRALATGTKWPAYVNTSSGFWKLSSNEFIHLSDAVWVG